MRIVLHGFGTFPILFFHMVQYARRAYPDTTWGIILTTDHHANLFRKLLGANNVCVLGNRAANSPEDIVSTYVGSLIQDIEAEKSTLKHRDAKFQRLRASQVYAEVREFMVEFAPDIALVSQVEGFDGKAFIAAAKSLSCEVVVPTGCRLIGGIYFSSDDKESFPDYADANKPGCVEKASELIARFHADPTKPLSQINVSEGEQLERFLPPLAVRAIRSLRRWIRSSSNLEWITVRVAIQNNLPTLRNAIWAIRTLVNQRQCHISSLADLPENFIFYPLQYSPESSINTPAPYFLDQMRAIDALRFAMPNNFTLVVKEHPSCIKVRSGAFVKELLQKAGVLVAHYQLPSIELIRRSRLTVSVTGTATLEAFLLNKPALVLGQCLSSNLLGGVCSVGDLSREIGRAVQRPIDGRWQIDSLARLISIRTECNFGAPDAPGEPVLRRANIERFTDGFMEHCRKVANVHSLPVLEKQGEI